MCYLFCNSNPDSVFGEDIPPKPRRALNADGRDAIEHIQLVHEQPHPEGLRGILTEAKLRPSKLHQADSCSFFAIGYRKSFDLQQDRWETARVLNSGWQASKNTARILVLCLGWGDGKTLKKEVKTLVLNILGMEVFAHTLAGKILGLFNPYALHQCFGVEVRCHSTSRITAIRRGHIFPSAKKTNLLLVSFMCWSASCLDASVRRSCFSSRVTSFSKQFCS